MANSEATRNASDTMLSLVFDTELDDWDTSRGFRLAERPRPRLDERSQPLDAENVIVRVLYAGVCGTDRSIWNRNSFKDMILGSLRESGDTVRILGHEMVGEIVEVGSAVHGHYGYQPGQVVAAESHIICERCYQCRIGENHVCIDDRILGISRDGCFAQYVRLPARVLWPTDTDKVDLRVAAVQEPFGNAVHACTAVDLRGKTIAIFGCGTIGMFSIMTARALGASRIIGIEPNPKNRERALRIGADEVIALDIDRARTDPPTHDDEVVRQVRRFGHSGIGVDVAIEMAGANTSILNAIQSVRRGGHVILFGITRGSLQIPDFERLVVDGVQLRPVIGRRIFQTWYVTQALMESTDNRIQSQVLEEVLDRGEGTIVPIEQFEPADFEARMREHPKLLLRLGEPTRVG